MKRAIINSGLKLFYFKVLSENQQKQNLLISRRLDALFKRGVITILTGYYQTRKPGFDFHLLISDNSLALYREP
jgi:hypothetical protein